MQLVSTDEVQAQLEEDLTDGEARMVSGALERLSGWALHYGVSTWTAADVPQIVKIVIITAALRWWNNPEDHQVDRAGDEQIGNFDRGVDLAMGGFTPAEIAAIQKAAGLAVAQAGKAFGSVNLTGRGTQYGNPDLYIRTIGPNGVPNSPGSEFAFFETEYGKSTDGHWVVGLG